MAFKSILLVLFGALAAQYSVAQDNSTNGNSTSGGSSDIDTLNYALALEHLEYAFYRDGIQSLGSNTSDPLYPRLVEIRDHEKAHVDAITQAITQLGGTPVEECEYDFGYNSSDGFLSVARVLENVGVSAYDGAAYLLQDRRLITAAATIASVEARHAAWLNGLFGLSPFPTAFDSPLDKRSVWGLASAFITNCSGESLSWTAYPQLIIDPMVVAPGATINVTSEALSSGNSSGNSTGSNLWCVFYASSASTNSTLQTDESSGGNSTYFCRVPDNAYLGDNFVFISQTGTYNLADTQSIVAGPALAIVTNATDEYEYEPPTNSTGGGGSTNTTGGV